MRTPCLLERLEERQLVSATPTGLTPWQIRAAYGFNQIIFTNKAGQRIRGNGAGQTIAIVDAFDDPTIVNDLKVFDRTFGVSDKDNAGKFALTVAYPGGKPRVDAGWAQEISLDVEWAHAVAPSAHILLVEAASDSINDLLVAVDYARRQRGVVAVSMSWGGQEFPEEPSYNSYITTPRGHTGGSGLPGGVTFFASAGDNGAQATWPAVSPNIIAVGGTTLTTDSRGHWQNEIAWSGSGGGYSLYQSTTAPDVGYDGDPNTGFSVYDSTSYQGDSGWMTIGGTSAGAPQWAALIAIADQGRAMVGKGSLDGPSQTLSALYNVPWRDFHDITQGYNGYYARPGYDLITGRGTPVANMMVPDLIKVANFKPTAVAATATSSARTLVATSAASTPAGSVLPFATKSLFDDTASVLDL